MTSFVLAASSFRCQSPLPVYSVFSTVMSTYLRCVPSSHPRFTCVKNLPYDFDARSIRSTYYIRTSNGFSISRMSSRENSQYLLSSNVRLCDWSRNDATLPSLLTMRAYLFCSSTRGSADISFESHVVYIRSLLLFRYMLVGAIRGVIVRRYANVQ